MKLDENRDYSAKVELLRWEKDMKKKNQKYLEWEDHEHTKDNKEKEQYSYN